MSPLEKVFFLKNMCHTGTSNGGYKVANGTFSSGLNNSKQLPWEKTEKEPPLKVRTGKPMTTTAI